MKRNLDIDRARRELALVRQSNGDYRFSELSDSAKETAREWWREHALDYEWWDASYEDAKECGRLIGIDIDWIYFTGFWSQGDGACFEGSYSYSPGCRSAIRRHAPTDEDLHEIAERLYDVQRRYFYRLSARVAHRGYYYHSLCTHIEAYDDGPTAEGFGEAREDAAEEIRDCLRLFMDWIYRQLEREAEYLLSNRVVDELLEANEYEFAEDGRIS